MNAQRPEFIRVIEIGDDFGRKARAPGGLPRDAAIKRAQEALIAVRPPLVEYVDEECRRLETTLLAARAGDGDYASLIAVAYEASQNVRDVAEPAGYSLTGFISGNLCTIIETAADADMQYPAAIIDCHCDALRLAHSPAFAGKTVAELPELSAGLSQTAQMTKALAARQSLRKAVNT
jgi:hypothetical protein